jgi:hypothetical protein
MLEVRKGRVMSRRGAYDPFARRYSLERYRRHARGGSTECLFETAVDDLTIDELGALSLYLQRVGRKVPQRSARYNGAIVLVDAPWKLPAGFDRVLFALELIAAGWERKDAIAAAAISRSTLQRELARSGLASMRNGGLETAFPCGSDVSNPGGRWGGSTWADLTRSGDEDPGNDAVTRSGPDPAQLELAGAAP